jgi:Kef-type K+ transport system membrane component KefB/nucleotide-binding universal stress UspA family protein
LAAPLTALAWVGAALLLLLTGLETDLRIVRRFKRAVLLVTVGALCVPAVTGLSIARFLPASFAGPESRPALLAIFMAIALSISSLPVIAKVLRELGYLRRDFAQVTLGVGMLNDLIGWLALGFLATLSSTGTVAPADIALRAGAVGSVIVVALLVGPAVIDTVLPWVRRRDRSSAASTAVMLTLTFALATATQAVGSEAVLGAYIAGVVISRCRCQDARVRSHLETVTFAVFAPLFFATAGLRMDLGLLLRPDALAGAALILAAAIGSKMIGAYASARSARLGKGESLAVAISLNARGAVEIVIATVGLSLGVLSQSAYTAIALMAILTSVITPPLLTATVRRWRGSAQEQIRLDQEESLRRNLLLRPGRLLVPLLSPTSCLSVAEVLHRAWPREAGVTVVLDGRPGVRAPHSLHHVSPERPGLKQAFHGRDVSYRWGAIGEGPQAVLEESELGYSAVGIALPLPPDANGNGNQDLIPPIARTLLSRGKVPLVAVRCTVQHQGHTSFSKLIVPVAGTSASRAALELGLGLAETTGAEIVLLHVADGQGDSAPEAHIPVLDHAVATATSKQVAVHVTVRHGFSVAAEILDVAAESSADLIVIGAGMRRTGEGLSFSHAVEEVLRRAVAAVAVVVTPEPGTE